MEVYNTILTDNGELVPSIMSLNADKGDVIPVAVNLPEYLDITSLLALEKRMVDTVHITGHKIRLVAKTSNLVVEKYATRIFANRDDIFLSVDWKDK